MTFNLYSHKWLTAEQLKFSQVHIIEIQNKILQEDITECADSEFEAVQIPKSRRNFLNK